MRINSNFDTSAIEQQLSNISYFKLKDTIGNGLQSSLVILRDSVRTSFINVTDAAKHAWGIVWEIADNGLKGRVKASKSKEAGYSEKVAVWYDPLTWWFEYGTKERYTKNRTAPKVKNERTKRMVYQKGQYRGVMQKKPFWQQGIQSGVSKATASLEKNISDAIKKAFENK